MSGFGDEEEEYRGTVTVVLPGGDGSDGDREKDGGAAVRIDAHLAGHFSPLTGDYRWRGRLSPSPEVTEAFQKGVRTVVVRTPDGFEGTGTLDEPNLWGGHPVNGAGSPPFAVPRVEIDDD
ncbi:DUF4873 domain-containing protein [Nocardiopsis halotolerans]|uniref:DUF4873 domain-containing protein n=1 Tax=Nocardiopsis halotolerans TaxID=124252 RepID=UPI00034AE2CE|nr:DUF4873 domain-containing protein [Nocardiopsis halotolerans]